MSTRRDFIKQTASVSAVAAGLVQLTQLAAKEAPDGMTRPMGAYKVPHTDLVVSRIAYGTAMLGSDRHSSDFVAKTVRAMQAAYDNGITFFDLADVYGGGKSEAALNQLLKQRPGIREKIVIQSKCGLRFPRGLEGKDSSAMDITRDLSREHIVSAAEASLRRLGTDRLDILLLHVPDPLVELDEVARAFDDLKGNGKVRYFGVSNHSSVQIELLKKYVQQPLVANQIRLSLAYYSPIFVSGLVDYCRLNEMQVQAYSPLKDGSVYDKPMLLNPPENAALEIRRAAQILADVAKTHAVSPAAIMLAWLLRHPAGIVPVIGTTQPRHVVDNCAADRVNLSREEWYTLFNAAAAIQPKVT